MRLQRTQDRPMVKEGEAKCRSNHRIIESSNHRIIESSNHRIIESSNHRDTTPTHLRFLGGYPGHPPVGERQPQPRQHPRDLVGRRLVEDTVEHGDLTRPEEHPLGPQPERLRRNLSKPGSSQNADKSQQEVDHAGRGAARKITRVMFDQKT